MATSGALRACLHSGVEHLARMHQADTACWCTSRHDDELLMLPHHSAQTANICLPCLAHAAMHRDKQAPPAHTTCSLNPCATSGFMEVYVLKRRFSLEDPVMSTFQLSASSS